MGEVQYIKSQFVKLNYAKKGVRLGCIIFIYLFKLYDEFIIYIDWKKMSMVLTLEDD